MKIYKVKVNGKVYEVELEAVSEVKGSIQHEEKAAAPVAASAGDKEIVSPITGNVLDVKVKVGDTVAVGTVIAVVEAMKLENDIVATAAGTVKQVLVSKGQTVSTNQVLVVVG